MRQIHRLLISLVLLTRLARSDDGNLLEGIRRKVIEQLSRSANYTCIEAIDRTYYSDMRGRSGSCEGVDEMLREETMHDRLRLNVAVSKGGEIFSWRGENNFSTTKIGKLVEGGPVSSGGFVGFLLNIFTVRGVKFTYRGKSKEDHVVSERFDYVVNQAISQYRIEGAANQSAVVPFHGSFSADASTLQLNRLEITADKIPIRVRICSAKFGVRYQIAAIAGRNTLIPSSFDLRIQDEARFLTVSRGQYNDCHEFRAQSILRFDSPEAAKGESVESQKQEWLPAGLDLQVALKTAIDSKTAYAGDAVEAVLIAPVRNSRGETLLPQNAILRGIVTQLQAIYQPETCYYLRIQFNSASSGGKTYRMRAIHKPGGKEANTLSLLYRDVELPIDVTDAVKSGMIVIHAGHLKLDSRFQGEWRTIAPDKVPEAPGSR